MQRITPRTLPTLLSAVCLVLLLLPFTLSAQALDVEYYGVFKQGGLMIGKVDPSSKVALDGRSVEVSTEGFFVAGFGRDAEQMKTLAVSNQNGETHEVALNIEQRDYAIQRIEGVPQRTVTPSESSLKRIRSETAMVKDARKKILARLDFLADFIAPANGSITGVYGSQRVYNGVPKRPHYGIDYAGPVGAPVIAPADGVVTLTHSDMYYSGGTLIIDHGLGLSSTFIHLSEVLVEKGQEVEKGQTIAKIGKGGRATGPHLDWRMNWLDERIDPALMLELELPEAFSRAALSSE